MSDDLVQNEVDRLAKLQSTEAELLGELADAEKQMEVSASRSSEEQQVQERVKRRVRTTQQDLEIVRQQIARIHERANSRLVRFTSKRRRQVLWLIVAALLGVAIITLAYSYVDSKEARVAALVSTCGGFLIAMFVLFKRDR